MICMAYVKPVSVLVVHERIEFVAGTVEFTTNALPSSCGLNTICSDVPGRSTYQPNDVLPVEHVVLPFQHTVALVSRSRLPDVVSTEKVCLVRFACFAVYGDARPVEVAAM